VWFLIDRGGVMLEVVFCLGVVGGCGVVEVVVGCGKIGGGLDRWLTNKILTWMSEI